jgi:hypothetical protein
MSTAVRLIAMLAVISLAGCDSLKRPEVVEAERQQEAKHTGDMFVIARTDDHTGCQYLVYNDGGITPRIAADGKTHMGCGGRHE